MRRKRLRTTAGFIIKFRPLFLVTLLALAFCPHYLRAQNIPLANGFAHNDYWHKRPLFDALDNGFRYVEADVFLINEKLIVAHTFPFFKGGRTLERLYLKPLVEYLKAHPNERPITLMIDIKTGGTRAYYALKPLLDKYAGQIAISSCSNGRIRPGQLTVVLSGHKPYKKVCREQDRMVFMDEDLRQMNRDTLGSEMYPMASCPYNSVLKWNGEGEIPAEERHNLVSYVECAHRRGKKVRLWASPENKAVWTELLSCGVDLINTDQLSMLRDFLNTAYAAK